MSARVRLDELLAGVTTAPAVEVAGLALDGRAIRPGEAFVAVAGTQRHGLEFVEQAIARGASAVLWDPADGAMPGLPAGVVAVAVPGLRSRLGTLADRFHGAPSARLAIAGVTGTNGKTTCAWLLAAAGSRLGQPSAYVGTLGAGFPPAVDGATLTTPDVISAHGVLARLAADGSRRVAMEVSSHALDQGRLDGVRVEIAAFTNLSRDHLDYHGSMAAYAAAKQRVFSLGGVAHAVINVGDATGLRYARELPAGIALTAVSVGEAPAIAAACTLNVAAIDASADGLELDLHGPFGRRTLSAPLLGSFNAENLAVVLGVLLAWGHDVDDAIAVLAATPAPPGRMERFPLAGGALAIVDYAHTPDALEKVLVAARHHAAGRVLVVFGCGGDRDAGKRAPMGAIAERLADMTWITDDNPRGEDPAQIVAMIQSGMHEPGRAVVERDRAAAIAAAITAARSGDIVVVAGKGHETRQLTRAGAAHFSDRECVARLAGVRP